MEPKAGMSLRDRLGGKFLPGATYGFLIFAVVWIFVTRRINRDGFYILWFDQVEYVLKIGLGLLSLVALSILVYKRCFTAPIATYSLMSFWLFIRDVSLGEYASWTLLAGVLSLLLVYSLSPCSGLPLSSLLLLPSLFLLASIIWVFFQGEHGFLPNDGSTLLPDFPLGRFSGLAPHPNIFAPLLALGLIVATLSKLPIKGKILLTPLFIVALGWTGADGSMLGAASGIFIGSFFLNTRTAWRHLPTFLFSAVAFFSLSIAGVIYSTQYGLNSLTTGRVTIWKSFLDSAMKTGLVGIGSQHYYDDPRFFDSVAAEFMNPHNTWIGLYIFGGIGAIFLYGLYWILVIRGITRIEDKASRAVAVGLSCLMLTSGMVESHFLAENETYFVLYGVLSALVSIRTRNSVAKDFNQSSY